MSSFAEARIDLDAISGNIALLAERAAGALVMGVVKADGYGHGMIPAARAALAGGATWLGTAFIAEALRLRAAGIEVYVTPITPRPGYTALQNQRRAVVNAFVREGGNCSGTCDAVFDFDAVLRDPANPSSIYPPYDTGDGVHANVAGQEAIAASIPVERLVPAGPAVTTDVRERCLAGTPYLAVRVTNDADVALDVDVATAYGSRSFAGVAPGASAYQTLAYLAEPADDTTVTVTARASGGGGRETVEEVVHAAPDC